MTLLTPEKLASALGCPLKRAQKWVKPLSDAMEAYDINTPNRISAFLAQIGHETGRLIYVKELWGPTPAQSRYEGRADLGNTQKGDGFRYRGRGLIQITGRSNYRRAGTALGVDFEASPELLEKPEFAALSAAWFWKVHGLNELADGEDFEGICDIINIGRKTRREGDSNGYAERLALWHQAKEIIT